MKRTWLGLVFVGVWLAGCGMSSETSALSDGSGSQNAGRGSESGGEFSGGESSSSGGTSPGAPPAGDKAAGGGSSQPPQAGQLTAGVWDDNLNFDWFKTYANGAQSLPGAVAFNLAERESARDTALAPHAARTELDVAFLIDTTGSMGDEITYLQSEIDSIAARIESKLPGTTPRYGLVLYRDNGDAYVTQSQEFQPLAGFRAALKEASAGGGGDLPEAVPEGLARTIELGWRTGDVARVAFWVADAPHHIGLEQPVRSAIDAAIQKNVHVYPVAASGTDSLTEYTMRSAAQITGGRYIFLTDDSGIGNAHAEPHIPCYHVTRFDSALVRVVESELSGTHVLPPANEIVRTVGAPQDGKCATKDGGSVVIY